MSILDFIGSKFEQHNKVVGKVECSGDEVTTIFLGLAKSVGMALLDIIKILEKNLNKTLFLSKRLKL